MADNITILDSSGSSQTVATYDSGGAHFQRNFVQGNAAHDSPISGNPVLIGGEARGAEVTAVASGDNARMMVDRVGRMIVMPYATSSNIVNGKTSAMTAQASTQVLAAPGAGLSLYVTTMIFTNSHASVDTEIVVYDNADELFRVHAEAQVNSFSINFPTPLKLGINRALNVANVTNGSNTYVAAVGFKSGV